MKNRIKKIKEDLPAEKPTRSNFWRMKLAPNEKTMIGDGSVHCVVVCKNCGPGSINITKVESAFRLGDSVELASGQLKIFWAYDDLQIEGDRIHPAVVDLQFMPIMK